LPEHLERREVVHDLTEAEKLCPCCGEPRVCIGEQATEQLDLEPAHFFVRRTVKKSYACRRCDPAAVPAELRLQTAGPAQVGPIAKGLCGPGLLAHVITAVLYTMVGTCKHLGIDPFAYLKEMLPGLFALGEKPTAEQLLEWLPDRWLLHRAHAAPPTSAEAG
jgi:transposase